MPSIEILSKHASQPSFRTWEETREYVAGNGTKAVFSNPFEFHMGAYSWKLEVFGEGLKKLLSKSGLICLHPYQPWSNDSGLLFLASWNQGAFLSLARDSFALILPRLTQCVGSLLDDWSEIEFDENTDVLKMMVYRPLGEIFEKRGQPVCKVDEHWVEVRLRP